MKIAGCLLSCFLFTSSYAQDKMEFRKGIIIKNDGKQLNGYIWLSKSQKNPMNVYFKSTSQSTPIEFSSYDIKSIEFLNNKELYISEAINGYAGQDRIFVQVRFQGIYSLISCQQELYETKFFLYDNEGNKTELINDIGQSNPKGETDVFVPDYKNTLYKIFNTERDLYHLIESSDFTSGDLTKILVKYHKKHNHSYEVFPIPPITWYMSYGASIANVKHRSDINNTFISESPLFNVSLGAGILTCQNKINIGLRALYYGGTIYHDNDYVANRSITAYYEDVYNIGIFSNELFTAIKVIDAGKFNLSIGVGFSYNIYVNYTRDICEEILFKDYDLVVTSYFSEKEKPDNIFNINAFTGIDYEINNNKSIELRAGYYQFSDNDSGPLNIIGLSLSVLQKLY